MSEKVECEICGESFDPRGLQAHKRMKHGVTDGGEQADGEGTVTVSRDAVDSPESVENALPSATVSENSITFRTAEVQEIVVSDEEIKQELKEELKQMIRESEHVQV
jgi:hypothetical protein